MSTAPRRLDPFWRRARRNAASLPPAPAGLARLAGLAWLADVAALTAAVVLAQLAATAPARAATSELPLHLRAAAGGARPGLPSGELVSPALPPGARLDAAAPPPPGGLPAGPRTA